MSFAFRDTTPDETAKLAQILGWTTGSTVGEIGAGHGAMTLDAAARVGATGHVFASELNPKRTAEIRKKAADRKLANISVIDATEMDANLPNACCESIFMRDVYHHFTHPAEMDASIFKALKPGGLLAIIDFPPSGLLSTFFPVKGVPEDRHGHGIDEDVLIPEVRKAGFELVDSVKDWPGKTYCMLFRKSKE